MDRAALIVILKTYDAMLRENGATGLYIFGSRARGDQRHDSDFDQFIDYDPEAKVPNIFRLMQIEEEIGETARHARHHYHQGRPASADEERHRARRRPHALMASRVEREASL